MNRSKTPSETSSMDENKKFRTNLDFMFKIQEGFFLTLNIMCKTEIDVIINQQLVFNSSNKLSRHLML